MMLIAPFIVLRIAGLRNHYAASLPDDLLQHRQQCHQQEQRLQQLSLTLTDRIYTLIALAAAESVRSELIRCRRHLYNQRHFVISDRLHHWLSEHDATVLDPLMTWLAMAQECQQRRKQFGQIWLQTWQKTCEIVTEAAAEPAMGRALSLAAPQLVSDLAHPWQSWPVKRRRRVERSVFAYMVRAAAKVSPFSTFASCSMMPLDREKLSTHLHTVQWRVTTAAQLNRSLALALREALYSLHHLAERGLTLHLNPSVQRVSSTQIGGYFYRYEKRRGQLWSEEQQFVLSLESHEVDAMLSAVASQSWLQWQAHFVASGIAPQAAERLLRKLVRKDLLRPGLQWGSHHPAPLEAVIALLPDDKNTAALRALPDFARQFCGADNVSRIAMLAQAQQTLRLSWQSLSAQPVPEIRNLLYEDAWSEGINLQLRQEFIPAVLARVAKVVARRASLSLEYLWLRHRFLEQFGAGGVCANILQFLQQSWQGFVNFSQQLISRPAEVSSHLYPHNISTQALRLPVTIFLQMCASSAEALHESGGRVVINNVYPRIGWQLARSTLTTDPGAELRQRKLQDWLSEVAAPALPLTFSVSGESSNLQAQARLADHHLCLDESAQDVGCLTLSQLRLRHDVDTGLLRLVDNEGTDFQLFYLGAATPMAAWGMKYLLTVLAEPLQIGRPSWGQLMADEKDADFRHADRVEEDNCVLIRETWWVRCSRLFREFAQHPADQHPALLLDLLLTNGIPADSYVNGQYSDYLSWQAFSNDKVRKPMWCRLGNPFCLDQLMMLAKKVDWLVFREALPSPEQSWMRAGKDHYVSEIHTEMVISGDDIYSPTMFPEQEKPDV